MTDDAPTTIAELLGPDAPKNWGKWGPDDEVGSLNYLTSAEVLRGVAAVRSGETFTLQVPIGSPKSDGDPVWPNRSSAIRTAVMDEGFFRRGEAAPTGGDHHYADDKIEMFLQGSTQVDALGHIWYDGTIYNGYDASTTEGSLSKASVEPLGERGIVGRGVLVDIARHRGVRYLQSRESFGIEEVLEAAAAQGVTIEKRDVLLLRTGWLSRFYDVPRDEFYADWSEPGLTYSPETVAWFQQMEIPSLVTDLIGNEATHYPGSVVEIPLHSALMRNLGVVFTEVCWLEELADACAADGRWTFLYTAAPLKVVGGSGAPVNPIVIR
ncbi:MAG: metal-dependent hydrolase [Naasia sp.]|jgi:kynurenine formamidase|uniref:cyclase family protein n=1 Tax=Naasia sp. TaxID=2546198 RepID=UPI00260C5084|nr:cyclase family protein [Naasia sp.]MCU1569950.1 metal-dependent hydrolase [Naasia sp.]